MKAIPTSIPDLVCLQPKVFQDHRGFFLESYNKRTLRSLGIEADFVQENHSRSTQHVLRGLHYQIAQAQGKLVRVIAGEVLDVAVDLRRRSPTFGQHVSLILSAENMQMLWIPPGFAHGFFVLSQHAEFVYRATDYYAPEHERILSWCDPALAIDWCIPPGVMPILSERDRHAKLLKDADTFV